MKKIVFMLFLAMVALGAAATDRLYIEDFSIASGETCTVSIVLDNEATYTAFQADLYLPAGLTIEQEDGDYIFDLTSRKGRDHNISSQVQADGAIRVMSYSPSIKAYSGNSGPLVTFQVIADGTFSGPATLMMKNIWLITTAGVELSFADEQCEVTVPTTALKGDVNGNGEVTIADVSALIDYLLGTEVENFNAANAHVNDDDDITIADVSALIDMLLSGEY